MKKNKTRAQKIQHYQKTLRNFDSWENGLGYVIDGGIRKGVVLLNELGFRTVQSCEGHLDVNGGTLTPWIDIQPKRGSFKRKVQQLLKDYWEYEEDRSGEYPAEFFMPYLWQFKGPHNRIRIQIGQEIFEKVVPNKARVPKSTREWVYKEKQKAWERFTDYLYKRYLGDV